MAKSSASTEQEKALSSWGAQLFKDAMSAKEKYTANWFKYLNAWNNSLYESTSSASYKSNQISNFIFSTIESMRPIMFDNNPKFEVIPVSKEAIPFVGDINQALDYEWHRTKMQRLMIANSVYTFTIGTSILMLPYQFSDKATDGVDGEVTPIIVNPFNLYPDPLATSVEDAEYIIYATYQHVNVLKKLYPEKAEQLKGADIQYPELVNDRNEGARITNQVLVLEIWTRDYTTISVEEEDANGGKVTKVKSQYPLGRVITIAPDLNLVLKDEPNPYETGRFPFFLFKDIDVPFQFWGEGEVKWLLSPQEYINDLNNQIIDNARNTANMPWIIDKNAGIPKGSLTNRPGLVIRKNPGSEVKRDTPPSMPMYVSERIESLKMDIEVISGVHDVTRGQTPTGIESGSAIMALQEAAQTRIRLKLQLHELSLGDVGTEWLARIKQFWKFNRVIPVPVEKRPQQIAQPGMMSPQLGMQTPGTPQQQQYDFISIEQDKQLAQSYRVKVVGSSTMQTNNNAMLDLMIRLAQTPMEDGMPLVTRASVLDFIPKVNKDQILQHFEEMRQQQMMMQQQAMMSQDGMSQIQGILGGLNEQVMGINNELGGVKQRFAQQDQKDAEDKLKSQGYDMGMKEAMAMQQQQQSAGGLPPELMEQLQSMSDQELSQFLQQNPEVAGMLG
jgi:hypothetical protein